MPRKSPDAVKHTSENLKLDKELDNKDLLTAGTHTVSIPASAFRFVDDDKEAVHVVDDSKEGEDKKPQLKMTAYSGKPVMNHWYWGNLIMNVEGVRFNADKYPILQDHMTTEKIAFTGKPKTDNNKIEIDPESTTFVDTEYANEFIKLSKQGFPYQASVFAIPKIIKRVERGEEVTVNGMAYKDIDSIFDVWEFKEASVCVFGHDSNTVSSAFAKGDTVEDITIDVIESQKLIDKNSNEDKQLTDGKEVNKTMTKDELLKEHAEIINQVIADESKKFSDEITTLKADIADKDKRILEFEKAETIRQENEKKAAFSKKVDSIWETALKESEIPERVQVKVRKQVNPLEFAQDLVLDETKFSEAVAGEIKDWEEKGITSSVIGMGFSSKTGEGDEQNKMADGKERATRLLKLAGHTIK